MGISVGCQVLSRVFHTLFGDLKLKFVYNFMDGLVVYSGSREEHLLHLRQVFGRKARGRTEHVKDSPKFLRIRIHWQGQT
jgi:hypothetical protein